MAQVSRNVLETLWDDGNFVLSRCELAGERAPVLALAPSSKRPARWIIEKLERTYALRETLDPTAVPRLLGLDQERDLQALLFEDPGGNLLAGL